MKEEERVGDALTAMRQLALNIRETRGKSKWRPVCDMSEYLKVINQANILLNKTCSSFFF